MVSSRSSRIDSSARSLDWQQSDTDMLVMPVGSMEQHGPHLPLATDSIQIEHFARKTADAFSAALLPCLTIATSMEHSGFRGSFSLQPETLMQVVRDIVEEAGQQGFRIVIVLNGHGGNHALVPVCRDINRHNGPVKIILVSPFSFLDRSLLDASRQEGLSIHAAETETSFMLALAPELVGDARPNMPPLQGPVPLSQPDLTTFGIGHFNREGVIGRSETASQEKGKALLRSAEEGLLSFLRDRIERLRKNANYSGLGETE